MRIALYAFLEFCVQRRDFPSLWLPPAMSDDEVVSTEKRIGYPMTDAQILRLIDSFPTDETGNKWRFACQLMAVYGLRPEDHLDQSHSVLIASAPAVAERLLQIALDPNTKNYAAVSACQAVFAIIDKGVTDRENAEQLQSIRESLNALEGGRVIDA